MLTSRYIRIEKDFWPVKGRSQSADGSQSVRSHGDPKLSGFWISVDNDPLVHHRLPAAEGYCQRTWNFSGLALMKIVEFDASALG